MTHRSCTQVLLSLVVLGSALIGSPASAQTRLGSLGGPGGGPFVSQCAQFDVLRGFDLRAADDVDALRSVCGSTKWPDQITRETAIEPFNGGGGGRPVRILCPLDLPAVIGMEVVSEGEGTKIVNSIHLSCGHITELPQQGQFFAFAAFNGPLIENSFADTEFHTDWSQACPPGQLAVGAHGRSGVWLDSVGLICAPSPQLTTAVRSIGKINTGPPVKRPKRTICQAADDAEQRQSPAAPDLRAQCIASKKK